MAAQCTSGHGARLLLRPALRPILRHSGGILPKVVHLFFYWGLGAILSGPFVPLFERHIPLSSSLGRWRDMLVPPLFVVFSALFLNAAILLRPVTYDRFLYAFDGSLGSSPDSGRRKC